MGEGRGVVLLGDRMMNKRVFEFGFDEQHDELTDVPAQSCPDCGAPVQASRLETVCLDCEIVVASECTA